MNQSKYFCLILFLFEVGVQINGVTALFGDCGEIHKGNEERGLAYYEEEMEFDSELEELFDASNDNDTARMEEAYKLLEKLAIDEKKRTKPLQSSIDYIVREGYPVEVHTITTKDGYVLEILRIPFSPKSPKTSQPKRPVFMMHGFLESANGWIVLGSENSLAYLLADAGYDVWMGNARGTERSRSHVTLSPEGRKQKQFWTFSWHEIGMYDVTASIDFVLSKTNQKRLHYVGFSQGTTSFFVMASMRPEYNDKIIAANLLAPVAFLKNNRNPLYHGLSFFYKPIKKLLDIFKIYKITLKNSLLIKIAELACRRAKNKTPILCKAVLGVLDSNQINCTSLPYILEHTPAGASSRQAMHYTQLMRTDNFQLFDYEDKKMNKKMYGSDKPPKYPLKKVSAPVNLYYSKDDNTGTLDNVMRLQSELPNVQLSYMVPVESFTHVDFIYSRYANMGVNKKVIESINKADANK